MVQINAYIDLRLQCIICRNDLKVETHLQQIEVLVHPCVSCLRKLQEEEKGEEIDGKQRSRT